MSKIDEARAAMDMADLVIAVMVESQRASDGVLGYANGFTISGRIGGAVPREVGEKLRKMRLLGVLEKSDTEPTYQLTLLGVELLEQDVEGFATTPKEDRRRDEAITRSIG